MPDHFTVTQVPCLGSVGAVQSLMRHFDTRPAPNTPMGRALEVLDRKYPGLDTETAERIVRALLKMMDSPGRPKFERDVVDAFHGRVLDAEFEDVARTQEER